MKNTIQNKCMNISEQNEIRKDKPRRRFELKIALLIFLFVLAGYIFMVLTWTPVDSESRKANEAIIRQAIVDNLKTQIIITHSVKYLKEHPELINDPNDYTDKDFAKITSLSVSGNYNQTKELSDIKLLEKFTNLQELTLYNTKFPEKEIPTWMKIMAKTGIFNLNKRFVLDLRPLKKLSNLQILSLRKTQVSNLKPLKRLVKLEELNLEESQFTDFAQLSDLTNLQSLLLDVTQITDLEPLSGLTKLKVLGLSSTKTSNLEPIKGLINLETLLIAETQVTNLEPISGLTKLNTLYINENKQISNIAPLKKLKNLKTLLIMNCPNITDEQVEDLQKALPDCEIMR